MEKAEVIKAFHLMWDNYPESAMLIDKKRNIIAANKVAPSTGRIEGNKCALVEPLEQHKGCRAEEAWKNGEASYRKKVGKLGDVVSFGSLSMVILIIWCIFCRFDSKYEYNV